MGPGRFYNRPHFEFGFAFGSAAISSRFRYPASTTARPVGRDRDSEPRCHLQPQTKPSATISRHDGGQRPRASSRTPKDSGNTAGRGGRANSTAKGKHPRTRVLRPASPLRSEMTERPAGRSVSPASLTLASCLAPVLLSTVRCSRDTDSRLPGFDDSAFGSSSGSTRHARNPAWAFSRNQPGCSANADRWNAL